MHELDNTIKHHRNKEAYAKKRIEQCNNEIAMIDKQIEQINERYIPLKKSMEEKIERRKYLSEQLGIAMKTMNGVISTTRNQALKTLTSTSKNISFNLFIIN